MQLSFYVIKRWDGLFYKFNTRCTTNIWVDELTHECINRDKVGMSIRAIKLNKLYNSCGYCTVHLLTVTDEVY